MGTYKPKDTVDELIRYFWKYGYLTIKRKYSAYLPPPRPIEGVDVAAIGKYKKKYVIGITLKEEDLNNKEIFEKIKLLANRKPRYKDVKVRIFLGVPRHLLNKAKVIIAGFNESARKIISIVSISPSARNEYVDELPFYN